MREIVGMQPITPIPEPRAYVRGVINPRGKAGNDVKLLPDCKELFQIGELDKLQIYTEGERK